MCWRKKEVQSYPAKTDSCSSAPECSLERSFLAPNKKTVGLNRRPSGWRYADESFGRFPACRLVWWWAEGLLRSNVQLMFGGWSSRWELYSRKEDEMQVWNVEGHGFLHIRYSGNSKSRPNFLLLQITCVTPPHAPGPVSVEFSSDDLNYTNDGCVFTYIDHFASRSKLVVTESAEVAQHCVIEKCRPLEAVWYNNKDDRGSC